MTNHVIAHDSGRIRIFSAESLQPFPQNCKLARTVHYYHQIETGSTGDHTSAKATRCYVKEIKALKHRWYGMIDKKISSKRKYPFVATKRVNLQQNCACYYYLMFHRTLSSYVKLHGCKSSVFLGWMRVWTIYLCKSISFRNRQAEINNIYSTRYNIQQVKQICAQVPFP